MKNFLLAVLILTAFSCSNDDNGSETPAINLDPPSWLIGTWADEFGAQEYRITESDISSINTFFPIESLAEVISLVGGEFEETTGTVSGSPAYEVSYVSGNTEQAWRFIQTSNNTMDAFLITDGFSQGDSFTKQ